MNHSIYLSTPNFSKREVQAVLNTFKKGWFSMGPETERFEEEFAEYIGVKYAVAVNSCTSALFLCLKYLRIGSGDEVIVPSFTFASSANVVVHCGATPVFVDMNEKDFTMDQESLERTITKKTKLVIPVHYGGNRANIKTNLPVVEDSAHLIPKNGNNNKAFVVCYSFYTTKNITTIDGGMIATSDKDAYEWFKKARLHGLSKEAWKRYNVKSEWTYTVEFSGYKCNTTDLNSAIGRVQLKRLDSFERRRSEVVKHYNKNLGLNNKATHLYPILIDKRDDFFQFMKNEGVGCSFHFTPLHLEPAFRKFKRVRLPRTEYVGSRVVTLPLDTVISDKDVKRVCTLVKRFLEMNNLQLKNVY